MSHGVGGVSHDSGGVVSGSNWGMVGSSDWVSGVDDGSLQGNLRVREGSGIQN